MRDLRKWSLAMLSVGVVAGVALIHPSTASAQTPVTLTLTPTTAMNTVGTSHTVTATVTDATAQPMPGVVVRFFVGGSTGEASGSCTTGTNGQCTFSYTGPQAGQDFIVAYADTDNDEQQDVPGEPQAEASKTWVPPSLVLTPLTATNTVRTSHTVTATVRRAPGTPGAGQPMPGVVVRFFVGGSTGEASGSCTTGTNGQCTFSYTGPQAGQDFIVAYADTDNDDHQDIPGETVAEASKTWVPATPGCPDNGGNGDEDGDGLTNNNESVFSTLLANDDSDLDGIADGNDDANGNGDDDEDEDDDEDDGCPDEDNDDDGEDDEDEDDDEDDDDD